MATFMHCFIEIWSGDHHSIPFDPDYAGGAHDDIPGYANVESFTTGEILFVNDTRLLHILGYFSGHKAEYLPRDSKPPLFHPRGLPEDVSREVYQRYYLEVADPRIEGRQQSRYDVPTLMISAEEAQRLTEMGLSRIVETREDMWRSYSGVVGDDGTRGGTILTKRITNPSWHNTNWMSLDELHHSMDHHGINLESLDPEFQIFVGIMHDFERHYRPGCTRVVYWFDN